MRAMPKNINLAIRTVSFRYVDLNFAFLDSQLGKLTIGNFVTLLNSSKDFFFSSALEFLREVESSGAP